MIHNPVLPGFPDPLFAKAVSITLPLHNSNGFPDSVVSFEELGTWELLVMQSTMKEQLRVARLPSAKGVWAPSLTFNEQEQRFYLAYSLMYSHNARYFDLDNFVITAQDITGPWSAPIYLHSVGFDPSFFHYEDGTSYVVCLQWELRNGEGRPDCIVIQEYDREQKKLVGPMKEIWRGGTKRGCLEGPHLFRKGADYYLFCAEGEPGMGMLYGFGTQQITVGTL